MFESNLPRKATYESKAISDRKVLVQPHPSAALAAAGRTVPLVVYANRPRNRSFSEIGEQLELLTINEQIERAINSLEVRVAKLETQDQTFKEQLMGLKEQLEAKLADQDAKIDLLQTTLETETAELKTEIDKLIADVSGIATIDISARTARIADLTNKISKLSDLTLQPDTEIPTTPTALNASAVTDTGLVLNWTPSTDNAGIDSYEVFQDGVSIGNPTSPSFTVSGLVTATTYLFSVRAKDKASNFSQVSDSLSVTTA